MLFSIPTLASITITILSLFLLSINNYLLYDFNKFILFYLNDYLFILEIKKSRLSMLRNLKINKTNVYIRKKINIKINLDHFFKYCFIKTKFFVKGIKSREKS